ncbi:aspartyl protease family protein [Luteirhabdus pelagi]|uniref:aspartyl protease family protein n=1 Tax=Luteirhabdus pelagi TaxID=2792783 RepID=UPI00193A4F33|nr:aspartyl protease family protein [Luteirhabdus pelagi]
MVPVTVNGTELSFLLDTGVRASIIFSLEQRDSLLLGDSMPVTLRGLGGGAPIEALRSEKNTVRLGKAFDDNHTLYVVYGSSLNLSPRMGTPIHGIIGYEFFKKFTVKTNYAGERLTFYSPETYSFRSCSRCSDLRLGFYSGKPFIDVSLLDKYGKERDATLLLDSGSSDAIWLFGENDFISKAPSNYFKDFLGLGLSGNIYGKRSRLDMVSVGDFMLQDVNVSFPDTTSLRELVFYDERDGSIGGDMLRRFTIWVDYKGQRLRLRKNRSFSNPFHYNMSGLTIQHDGLEVYEEQFSVYQSNEVSDQFQNKEKNVISANTFLKQTRFSLVPRYVVAAIRPDSPGAKAGLRVDDEIIEINNKPAHKFELYELNALFTSEEGKEIELQVRRNGRQFKVQFKLEPVL